MRLFVLQLKQEARSSLGRWGGKGFRGHKIGSCAVQVLTARSLGGETLPGNYVDG